MRFLLVASVLALAAVAAAQDDKPAIVKDFEARKKAEGAADAGAPDAEVEDPNVTIEIRTSPRIRARIYYGREFLGRAPLTLERKRDSGPLDLVVRAHGYLPVYTRAYTWTDDTFTVELTKEEEKHTLFGYKAPLDAGPDAAPDAGPDGGSEEAGGDADAGVKPAPSPVPIP